MQEYLTDYQIARKLNISSGSVRSMVRKGQMPGMILPNKEIRIPVVEFEAWVRQQSQRPSTAAQPAAVNAEPTTK